MKNCLVTALKGAAKDNDMMYLDKGVLVFDNSINPVQTSGNGGTNGIRLYNANSNLIITDQSKAQYVTLSGDGYSISVSTDTPANTEIGMLYKLDDITRIVGANGSGYADRKYNFKMYLRDLCRLKNVTDMSINGVAMIDDWNIEKLGKCRSLTNLAIAGYVGDDWKGEIINFADNLVAYGHQPGVVVVAPTASDTAKPSNITINGQKYRRFYHIVLTQNGGYDIYAPISSSTALDDYSSYTPVYSK